jgi:hypothetical protein
VGLVAGYIWAVAFHSEKCYPFFPKRICRVSVSWIWWGLVVPLIDHDWGVSLIMALLELPETLKNPKKP